MEITIPKSTVFPVVLFAALAALVYWPAFTGRIPLATDLIVQFPTFQDFQNADTLDHSHAELGDSVTQFYPWRIFSSAALRSGTIPLWDPHLLAGRPYQANPLSALFYPFNWIFLVLPVATAWTTCLVLKPFLAGLFTFLLLRAVGVTVAGSISGGVVFAYSGFMTAWLVWPQTDVTLWLPLMCLAVVRLSEKPSRRNAVFTALAFSLPILAGHPGVTLFTIMAAAAYGLWLTPWSHSRQASQMLAWLAVAGVLTVGITLIQVLPSFEWLSQIDRTFAQQWAPRPLHEALVFFSRDMSRSPNSAGINIPLGAGYAGALSLLAAVLAVFHPSRRHVWFYVTALFFSLGAAYGIQPIGALIQSIPVLSGVKSEVVLVVANFSIAMLAGFGISLMEDLQKTRPTVVRKLWMLVVLIAATAAFHAATAALSKSITTPSFNWWQSPRSFRVLLVFGAILIILRLANLIGTGVWAGTSTALIILDLASFSYGHIPLDSAQLVFPKSAAYEFLGSQAGPFRVATLNNASLVNAESVYALDSAGGYDFMSHRLWLMAWYLIEDRHDSISFTAKGVTESNNRILDLLNVKYLFATPLNESASLMDAHPDRFRPVWSDRNVRIFENARVLPRAFLIPQSQVEIIPNDDEQASRLRQPSFDPAKTVILDSREGLANTTAPTDSTTEVTGFEEEVNSVRLRVRATAPSVLVLSQMYYPGWQVYIDKRKGKVLRVDYAFAGTLVDPGEHEIEFKFAPRRFFLGAAISSLSVLAGMALAWGRPMPREK